jgi:O-antigen ligase
LFPEKYWKVREICSSIALKVWNKEHWLGTGIGSFAIDIPFHAKPVDWIVLKEGYNTAINGWWQILAECGLIGILSILLVFGGMLFSFLRRFILSLGIISYYPAAALGIISSTVVLSQGFFDLTFLRPEVIVPIVALFSIGTGSFISASNNRTDVKNASDNG